MISNQISAAVETIKEHSTSENRSMKRKLEDQLAEKPSLTERAKAARVSESYEWKKEGLGKQYERVVKGAEYLERAAHVLPADLSQGVPSDAAARLADIIAAGAFPHFSLALGSYILFIYYTR